MITLSVVETTWGWLGLAWTGRGLRGLTLPEPTAAAASRAIGDDFPEGQVGEPMADAESQLRRYFQGEPVRFDVPLDIPEQPPFWHRVWKIVAMIPYGETTSYQAVAAKAGAPKGARAVGAAMAHNPVPVIIPCHRVIGSDGSLTGFGGGLDMKRRMLEMEQANRRDVQAGRWHYRGRTPTAQLAVRYVRH